MKFQGIIPPVSTIVDEMGELDEKGMGLLIDSIIEAGVHGLFFLGTGGEFSQFSVEERKKVAAFSVQYVNGRVPVLIGTGSTNTRDVIELNKHSEKIGADGVVVINPYYWVLSEANLFEHFSDIAGNTSLPILLYNFPDLTGQDISPDLVVKLAERHENIVGIKETIDKAGHIREVILKVKAVRPDFAVFCGLDDYLLNTLVSGGAGGITATTNFLPKLTIDIYEEFKCNNYKEAIALQQKLISISSIYTLDSPVVSVIKEATEIMGLDISTHVLPPARQLSAEKKQELVEILKDGQFV